MSDTHERLWHEWYAVWHDADASKAKPSYEEWLEARIEALEKTKGLVIPRCEWSICARHNRAYWTEEGCLSCRIEALDKERDAWKDAALKQAKALGAARILDDRDWANMPVFVKAAQALDAALRGEEKP